MNKFDQLTQKFLSENSDKFETPLESIFHSKTYKRLPFTELPVKAFNNSDKNVQATAQSFYSVLRSTEFLEWFETTFKKHLQDNHYPQDNEDYRGIISDLKLLIHRWVR